MATIYAVTMIKRDGTEEFSRVFVGGPAELRKARNWAKWVAGNISVALASRVMEGGCGGMEVARYGEE